jgi:hypothetical protein
VIAFLPKPRSRRPAVCRLRNPVRLHELFI